MASSHMMAAVAALRTSELVLVGGFLAFIAFILSTTVQWYRLRHVPGPFLASVTSLWSFRSIRCMHFHDIAKATQEKYGQIVRISPIDVLVSDPEALWYINSARSPYSRGDWYGSIRFNPYGDSVFSEMDTAKHDKRKSKLSFGFSGKGLMNIESNVDTQLSVLVDVLRKKVSEGQGQAIVDIGRLLQYFQVDLITFAGMGKAWGNMTSDKDHYGYLASGDEQYPFVHSAAMVPVLRWILFSPLFLRLFGPSPSEGWLGTLRCAVENRVSGDKAREYGGDMLGEWLKHGITPAEAELDLSLQMPAGTETSISTIRGIMMYLMTSPRILQKLRREIADGIRDGRISSPITNDEAKRLPYLQAIINEGMRVTPPLVAGFSKKVPSGGDIICGKSLPEGTEIHANFISLMRDQKVFGHDVEVFRPERFIDCDDTTRAKRLKVVDLLFGYGRWQCLGKVLAWMEMNKIFVELWRSFDFQVLNPERPWIRESSASYFIKQFNARVSIDTIDSAQH